ncbi:MAG: DUF4299 family protein [Clostridia bacterium]|nr:DUF4299 family protein [Clostridia bacterium]
MSVEIQIENTGEKSRPLPLEIILGDKLAVGKRDFAYRLTNDAENEAFTAFLPSCKGRGFDITYDDEDRESVSLHLPIPAAPDEVSEFFYAVARVSKFWDYAPIVADGNKMSPEKFVSQLGEFQRFNAHAATDMFIRIISGESGPTTLFCAIIPITIGAKEALSFEGSIDNFASYLDQMQSDDFYYAAPTFKNSDSGVIGTYVISEGVKSVFPIKPSVPFGLSDKESGKPLECSNFRIAFYSGTYSKILGEMDYNDFISLIPDERREVFDASTFSITLTVFEMQAMLGGKALSTKTEREKERYAATKKEKLLKNVSSAISLAVLAAIIILTDFEKKGPNWISVIVTTACALIMWLILFLIGKIPKRRKPFDATDLRARKKLDEAEKNLGIVQSNKFVCFIHRGQGLKEAYCEGSMYFLADRIYLIHWYFGKIYSAQIGYDEEISIDVDRNLMLIDAGEDKKYVVDLKTADQANKAKIIAKKMGFYKAVVHKSFSKLFMTYYDAVDNVGGRLIEFRFADAVLEKDEIRSGKSLYVSYRVFFELCEKYGEIFFPNDESDFVRGGSYTSDETDNIINNIISENKNDETLVPWLVEAKEKHGGFTIVGHNE